jgi:glyoxylase-like metal-dependent hydrolase (beta-lactamase superfamily II)/rhodanese-related sulfurtransferase
MIFEQFYLGCLAHASYLIGSEGIAAVIDPQRDVNLYLEAAAERGLRIAHIIETHLHADFVSGHQELAERTGATIYLGEGSGATFPHHAVREGDEIAFGKVGLHFLQTPGHTLESVSVVVTDREKGDAPAAVLTGDTLFIGDVGRPDLCETKTPQELARLLYSSLREKILKLPDETLVYPAHGAGSMCGRNISADRNSTIGRERRTNYALQPMEREAFVAMMTEDLPPRPEYFQRDVDYNRRGAAALESLAPLKALPPAEAQAMQASGAVILDTRNAMEYASGHIPRSIQIGLGGQFASWAGAVLGLDRELILVAEDQKTAEEARMRLARVGIERVAGAVAGGVAGWVAAGLPLVATRQITVRDLHDAGGEFAIWDVRRAAEWKSGHIVGAELHPLDSLAASAVNLDRSRSAAIHCKSGYRSAIACSLLEAAGFEHAVNVIGGYDAWAAAGFPVEELAHS